MIRLEQRAFGLVLVTAMVFAGGCAQRFGFPTATPSGEEAPVTLRNLEIDAVDGSHAVLLRLSRLPTLIRHSSSSNPGRITIEAWGPPGTSDLPERILPQQDAEVAQVRVWRERGGLTVVLDLHRNAPPRYTVHEMADWIMVRFASSEF